MSKKKGNPKATPQNQHPDNSTPRFSSGNAGIAQRKFIRHLLAIGDGGFDHMNNIDRLQLAGTAAIREVMKPFLNPLEYISQLRHINGHDCIVSVQVPEARISDKGGVPIYYHLPVNTRQAWRNALQSTEGKS